jgi:coenzyme F420-reducing hydrogenase alpha subunit
MVGGWSTYPTHGDIDAMKERVTGARDQLQTCVDVWAGLEEPQFERQREFVAIRRDDEYAFVDGDLALMSGVRAPVEDYKKYLQEDKSNYSYAKEVETGGSDFMVGALARLNINHDLLKPFAKKVTDQLGITLPNYNTFLNNAAQLVETAQIIEMAEETMDSLLKSDLEWHEPEVTPKAGKATHITEAPRGTLVHSYEFDDKGLLTKADIIAPTTMNYRSMEEDVKGLWSQIATKSTEDIKFALNRLIRAYDPCISCSCHVARII